VAPSGGFRGGLDRAPGGKQGKTGDRVELKLWDGDGSCANPDHRFKGPVIVGDVDAESEGAGT
jgi:hypothetical protein